MGVTGKLVEPSGLKTGSFWVHGLAMSPELFVWEMPFLLKHFWIFFLFAALANGLYLLHIAGQNTRRDPSLKSGYRQILLGFLIILAIPAFLIGIPVMMGWEVDSLSITSSRNMSVASVLFNVYLLSIWIFGSVWIYFRNGARFLARHRVIRINGLHVITDPRVIKLIWTVVLLGGLYSRLAIWMGWMG